MQPSIKNTGQPMKEYFILVTCLFISTLCVFYSGVIYNQYLHTAYTVFTTGPFVNFGDVKNVYYNNKVINTALVMNKTLLQKGRCMTNTSDYTVRPETRSPACACIINEYGSFIREIAQTWSASANVSDSVRNYYVTPWIPNPIALNWTANYTSKTIVIPENLVNKYADQTLLCLNKRSTWELIPYIVNIHPVAMSFYTSCALFMLFWSLVFRVMANKLTGDWTKWFLFFFALASSTFLFLSDLQSNWIYATALLCICIHFVASLGSEFSSMVEDTTTGGAMMTDFQPPHPIMVGLWYVIVINFPIMVVYLGLSNLQRDIVGLLGYFVVGFIIATCVQRIFWVQWYMQPNINVVDNYRHSEISSWKFRSIILTFLILTYTLVTFFATMLIFMQWYDQGFTGGNWIAMILGMVYVLIFIMQLFSSKPSTKTEGFELGGIQIVQILLVVGINIAFVIATTTDAMLI